MPPEQDGLLPRDRLHGQREEVDQGSEAVTEAQSRLPGLIRQAEEGLPVRIRRRDETVAFLVSRARMEAIVETMEILASPEAMKAIAEHRAGRTKFRPLSALGD